MRRSVAVLVAAATLASCWQLDNPVDPEAESYQGYTSDRESKGSVDADYTIGDLECDGDAVAGRSGTGSFTVRNLGSGHGEGSVYWTVRLSSDESFGSEDEIAAFGEVEEATVPLEEEGLEITFELEWPDTAGTVYLAASVSADNDTDATNNTAAGEAIEVQALDVDYTVSRIELTGGTSPGGGLYGQFVYRNDGDHDGLEDLVWTAYLSADAALDDSDPLVDAGTGEPALCAGASSEAVAFEGTWPPVESRYCLIVVVIAGDDVDHANDTGVSAAVAVSGPPASHIDYVVSSVENIGATVAGQAASGTFVYENSGSEDGTQGVSWAVYASQDTEVDEPGDYLLAAGGPEAGLAAGGSSPPLEFSGTWPGVPGPYYILVRVAAADEAAPGNNTGASADTVDVALPPPPNYRVSMTPAPVLPDEGAPMGPLSGEPEFTIDEVAGNPGSADVAWSVYASQDAVLSAGDVEIASGTESPPEASKSMTVGFSGSWPGDPRYYRLIIRLEAADDGDPMDDMYVSAPIPVPLAYVESEPPEDNSGTGPVTEPPPFPNEITPVSDYGIVFELKDLYQIEATMDAAVGDYDTFKITAGVDVTAIELEAGWATGSDDIDLYFWDEYGNTVSSAETSENCEPGSPPLSIIGLTPGDSYYIGVFFYLDGGSGGHPYILRFVGRQE